MIEGLFILTTIFVAYVVYAIVDEQKTTAKSKAPAAKPEPQAVAVEQPKPQVAVTKEKPAETKTVAPKATATKAAPPVAAKPAATKAAAKPATTKTTKSVTTKPATAKKPAVVATQSTGLKDPKTGEIATTYSNYRFTKRWIKDALVAEGLLEKVYSANELNAETDAKIKEAIAKLESMDQYKA